MPTQPLHPDALPGFFEFFAGGGMVRLGLAADWNSAFANDICEKKASSYRAVFGAAELRVCDVAALTTADLPGSPALAWASFPCQDLSLAGAGAGLEGSRSGTFKPFWKLIRALAAEGQAPRAVVLENVNGALSSHRGKDFAYLTSALADAGYGAGTQRSGTADSRRPIASALRRIYCAYNRRYISPLRMTACT